jgi:predicted small integral membrane protein
MDTTFPNNALMHRAITDQHLWAAAYAAIIAIEGLTCLLLIIGALALLVRLTAPAESSNRAKVWAVAGLSVGFGLWFFGFLVIAAEYFAIWQSHTWNTQDPAFRITMVILGALIFLCFRTTNCVTIYDFIGEKTFSRIQESQDERFARRWILGRNQAHCANTPNFTRQPCKRDRRRARPSEFIVRDSPVRFGILSVAVRRRWKRRRNGTRIRMSAFLTHRNRIFAPPIIRSGHL